MKIIKIKFKNYHIDHFFIIINYYYYNNYNYAEKNYLLNLNRFF